MDLKNATINIILGNYYNAFQQQQQQQQANVAVRSNMPEQQSQSSCRTTRAQARCENIQVQQKRQAERTNASSSVTDNSREFFLYLVFLIFY